MPSLAITQPYAARPLDLIDASDRSYRQIESAYAAALQIQRAMTDLTNVDTDPTSGTFGDPQSGAYFMPSSISAANRVVYEALVNALNASAIAIPGTRTSATKFTPTVSNAWPVNGLVGKGLLVFSYVDGVDDFAIATIASNDATSVTIAATSNLLAGADTIKLVALSGTETTLFNAIMAL
jgi:hypothetical protein